MVDLLYDVKSLAQLIIERDMSVKDTHVFLSNVWKYDGEFLFLEHRFNKKKFILDVMNEVNYLQNKEVYDREIKAVNQDFEAIGSDFRYCEEDDLYDLRSYFMTLRLRMVFLDKQDYVRMKLRTLLKDHGYKRRSMQIKEYLKQCMYFYHIMTFVRGGEKCDIDNISLDEMITFRVLGNVKFYIEEDKLQHVN